MSKSYVDGSRLLNSSFRRLEKSCLCLCDLKSLGCSQPLLSGEVTPHLRVNETLLRVPVTKNFQKLFLQAQQVKTFYSLHSICLTEKLNWK